MFQAIVSQVLLTWKLMFDKRVPVWMKAVVIGPILYAISPIDIIPDFILGLGQLDDLGLILAGMRLFEELVPEYIVAEHRATIARHDDPNTIEGANYRVRTEDEKPKRG